jgi:L-cystine uptake protein TcyP (sodium:dicarboxylate symporter family)
LYLTVPFIEEACKAAIALFIIKLMAGGAATKTKAMVVALSLGCMFGIVESHIYISVAEASNYEISWWMLIIRWGLCPILHMVATGAIVWGFWDIYGLVHRKGMDLSVVRKAASVMLAGYLIHAMYNLAVYVVECYHMGTL